MDRVQFSQLSKQSLRVGTPMLLAALFLAATLGTGTSGASVVLSVTPDHQGSTLSSASVITMGVAAVMSGLDDWLGWPQANAVQLAVEQANAAGGVLVGGTSYTIALVSADDECDPTQAITAANSLLDAGVVAVVGHSCSRASIPVQSVYAAAGVPMVSPSSTSPQLTEQGYATTFRVMSRDDSPPAMLAAHLRNPLAYERAAIVEMDGFWGGDWAGDVFSDTFTTLGGTITSRHTLTSTAGFTATLTTIIAEDPHAIHFANDDGSMAGLLSKAAHGLGMTDVVIAWSTYTENRGVLQDYANTAVLAAEGDIAFMYWRAVEDMPGYEALNADYVAAGFAHYGEKVGMCGAFAYDAARIIIAAIGRADSVNPSDIRDAIATTSNYPGVVGTYMGFDHKGDVIPQWAWMEQYQDGQWVAIWPYEVFLPIMLKSSGW